MNTLWGESTTPSQERHKGITDLFAGQTRAGLVQILLYVTEVAAGDWPCCLARSPTPSTPFLESGSHVRGWG